MLGCERGIGIYFMSEITKNISSDKIMIHADGITKKFGETEVLKGIDLDVTPGEVIAVIGPSGSGKSTMLRCLIGLEKISAPWGTLQCGSCTR